MELAIDDLIINCHIQFLSIHSTYYLFINDIHVGSIIDKIYYIMALKRTMNAGQLSIVKLLNNIYNILFMFKGYSV